MESPTPLVFAGARPKQLKLKVNPNAPSISQTSNFLIFNELFHKKAGRLEANPKTEHMRLFIKILKWSFALLIVGILLLFWCYKKVGSDAAPFLYTDASQVPFHKAALLLGTSKDLRNGRINPYFKTRIDAAVALYNAGKVKYIIASGDNSVVDYNEPEQMKQSMMEQGVPDSAIVLDYAGFRTFDSVIRCEGIFGQHSFIVVSQQFHNERALYITQQAGMDAIAFNAADPFRVSIRNTGREILARVKVMLDMHVLPTKPKFGGEKIVLN